MRVAQMSRLSRIATEWVKKMVHRRDFRTKHRCSRIIVLAVLVFSTARPERVQGAEIDLGESGRGAGVVASIKSGPEVVANSLGMKLVLVPAGECMMGAEEE